jgi:hypothetical protein
MFIRVVYDTKIMCYSKSSILFSYRSIFSMFNESIIFNYLMD